MLTPRNVLNQAHNEAVFFCGVYDECGNLSLSQFPVGFQTALTADQIVSRAVGGGPLRYGDGSLEAKLLDVPDNTLKGLRLRTRGFVTLI
jgi:hypothetical protein